MALALLASACGGSGTPAATGLAFSTSTDLSAREDAPLVVDAFPVLALTFSEPIDGATVPGNVTLQAARPGGAWVDEAGVDVAWSAASPAEVIVRPRTGQPLPQGAEYRLRVTTGLRSTTGKSLDRDRTGYLATDYALDLETGIGALGTERSLLYVISDVHMGDARGTRDSTHRYGWFIDNQEPLVRFLGLARANPNLRELVVAGDLFDGWVVPMDFSPLGERGTPGSYLDEIAGANEGVMSAFRALMDPGHVTVTWVPGNHDMLFDPADVGRHLPKIQHARDRKGLGAYSPAGHPEIVVEHGHRYDFFSAPDPISNLSITGGGSILPPGFWVSRVAASSVAEHGRLRLPLSVSDDAGAEGSGYPLYGLAWLGILLAKPVTEPWSKDAIVTGIDGYAHDYAIRDFLPFPTPGGWDATLYGNVEQDWAERQRANGVAVEVPKEVAMTAALVGLVADAQAEVQYFARPGSPHRIVVFGHTHEVRLARFRNWNDQAAVYANSGTWADAVEFGKDITFVAIVPPPAGSVLTIVSTYRYGNGQAKRIASAAVRIAP